MSGIDWPKPKRMTRTRTQRATHAYRHATRNARAHHAQLSGDINYARGGTGCYIQARAHPPTRDPPNHTATVPAVYTYYFAHYITYLQKHPPTLFSNQDPPPPIFSTHHLLSAHSETPPVIVPNARPPTPYFLKNAVT